MKNLQLELSIKHQRRAIGWLGISLPFILCLGVYFLGGCKMLPPSISDTFYTCMGVVFTGFMISMGIFFINNPCYERSEKIAFVIAGICAIIIALRSCNHSVSFPCVVFVYADDTIRNYTHLSSATIFFLDLAYICIVEFPKIRKHRTKEKIKRNIVYKICGLLIILSILAKLLGANTLLIECTALIPFGIAFLTNSDIILKDRNIYETNI